MCLNTLGSYICACKYGYGGDGRKCYGELIETEANSLQNDVFIQTLMNVFRLYIGAPTTHSVSIHLVATNAHATPASRHRTMHV